MLIYVPSFLTERTRPGIVLLRSFRDNLLWSWRDSFTGDLHLLQIPHYWYFPLELTIPDVH